MRCSPRAPTRYREISSCLRRPACAACVHGVCVRRAARPRLAQEQGPGAGRLESVTATGALSVFKRNRTFRFSALAGPARPPRARPSAVRAAPRARAVLRPQSQSNGLCASNGREDTRVGLIRSRYRARGSRRASRLHTPLALHTLPPTSLRAYGSVQLKMAEPPLSPTHVSLT